jgi:citrate lyase subunit beta/citryl-CoA lyase
MAQKTAVAGNEGEKVRSDCRITLEIRESGGVVVDLVSKVKRMYGDRMTALTKEVLTFFGISHARVKIVDSGSLDFVLAARLEAAVGRFSPAKKKSFSPPCWRRTSTPRSGMPSVSPGCTCRAIRRR